MKKPVHGNGSLWASLLLAGMLYLFSLLSFLGHTSDVGAAFAILMVWVIAYERGYKLFWKRRGKRVLAVVVFAIPSFIGIIALTGMLLRWIH
jgi:TctA family transporter